MQWDTDNFSEIETIILNKWQNEHIFQQKLNNKLTKFVFYDGPPFANGLPHYGHLLTGFIKDVFGRYQTMQGKNVSRRFGWDCHGLPAEMYVEKKLNISGKVSIEKYGIENFNKICQKSVLKYTNEWQEYVNRQGRWVNFANDYKTMDINYMESVLWAFKQLYEKGLVYEDMRVMPYSWACETPVSDFETRMDNSYREKKSKAVTLGFKITANLYFIKKTVKNIFLTIWTTTPWTLPSNLAVAVGDLIEYVAVLKDDNIYIIATALLPKYKQELGDNIIAKFNGKDLVGCKYQPPFAYFAKHPNAFKVLAADFVTTEDGTGLVHIAPGFGEDDQVICQQHNIKLVCPVDESGKFTAPVDDYIGKQVFTVNDDIILALKQNGLWLKTEQYIHNYPHCWRTDTPLIYRAVPSWYIKVTKIKNKMIANNNRINWTPGHVKNGLFGKWLKNSRDWSISRNRFWGCPIPVWQSDDPRYPCVEVYGSIRELEYAFNVKVKDLHRPFIDELTKLNPKDPTGRSKLRRVPYILDCWFESGSMPFAQMHYPFDNKDWLEDNLPADLIVEYIAQTRGWFYTLLVLSTALFDKPPFLNCICHGVILGDGRQKLSKRLKNYPDPKEAFTQYGADAMRVFMLSSPVMRGQELVIDSNATGIKEAVKNFIQPFWNAYKFYNLYVKTDKINPTHDLSSNNILDKYIIAKLQQLIVTVQQALDSYDTIKAYHSIGSFLEVLNNWYIRRSRVRFWQHKQDADKQFAYNTLYACLTTLCRVAAPLAPLITEAVYLAINNTSKSVHLEKFPSFFKRQDDKLIENMDKVRYACSTALRIRHEQKIRTRQPLPKVTFIGVADNDINHELQKLILDEVNVKIWENLGDKELLKYADYKLKINFPVLAKRLTKEIKDIIVANRDNEWKLQNNRIEIAGQLLTDDEFELNLTPKKQFAKQVGALPSNDALVLLDLNICVDLELEGISRDIIRLIQQSRKKMGLCITDQIILTIHSECDKINSAVSVCEELIKEQTLCTNITPELKQPQFQQSSILLEKKINLQISKI